MEDCNLFFIKGLFCPQGEGSRRANCPRYSVVGWYLPRAGVRSFAPQSGRLALRELSRPYKGLRWRTLCAPLQKTVCLSTRNPSTGLEAGPPPLRAGEVFLFPVARFLLPVARCLFPVARFLLPVACCLFPVACCLLPVASKMRACLSRRHRVKYG